MIKLGSKVLDKVTCTRGTVIGRCEFLYASPRVEVALAPSADGKFVESVWLDLARLEVDDDLAAKLGQPEEPRAS